MGGFIHTLYRIKKRNLRKRKEAEKFRHLGMASRTLVLSSRSRHCSVGGDIGDYCNALDDKFEGNRCLQLGVGSCKKICSIEMKFEKCNSIDRDAL